MEKLKPIKCLDIRLLKIDFKLTYHSFKYKNLFEFFLNNESSARLINYLLLEINIRNVVIYEVLNFIRYTTNFYGSLQMYGRYTKDLGEFAKDEARKLKILEKRRKQEDKQRNKVK